MTSILLALFFFGASALHVAWAFGWTWGLAAALPQRSDGTAIAPGRAATLAVAAALSLAGVLVTLHTDNPGSLSGLLLRGVSLLFLARAVGEFRQVGFFKRIRGTRFATFDTWLFSPLCVAVAAGLWTLARR